MDAIENTKSTTTHETGTASPPSTFDVSRFTPGSLFDVFPSLAHIKNIFDYIGGSREECNIPFLRSPLWSGLWWGLLAGLILLFCGQTSKFIYIDF